MQLSDIPAKFNIAFASSAGGGFIRTVPQAPTGTPGQASLQNGFPPETFQPVAAGGVPPFGQDFNGLLNQSTAWNRWQGAGAAFPPYDATFQTAVGGYPQSAIVASLVEPLLMYYSLVDNNVTNPDNGGAGWLIWSRRLTVNTTIYVNGATGNDSNNGLTPATAKATIQAAINTAWTYPPNPSFTITIQVADGTYSAGGTSPLSSGPNIIINGNAVTPANVVVSSGTAHSFVVQGPNTMTVQNLKVQTAGGTLPPGGFIAFGGATMLTNNTVSGPISGAVWEAFQGTVFPGVHSFTGNAQYIWWSNVNGAILFLQGTVFTISNAISVTFTVNAVQGGAVEVPPPGTGPTFVNPGNVTGTKYNASINGTVNTGGAGVSYFPGSVAGSTATGGQYV